MCVGPVRPGPQSNQNSAGISFLPNATQTQAIGLTSIIGGAPPNSSSAGGAIQASSSLTAPQQTSITQGALARRRQRQG